MYDTSMIEKGPIATATRWLYGLWEYYRGYTHSAIHAAAVAALTIFGLLIFIDPLFAILAIASYLFPPIVLYALDADVGTDSGQSELIAARASSDEHSGRDSDTDSDSDDGDCDSDTDSDSDDGDYDSDSDDGDSDSDRAGTDADSDTDTDG